MLLLRMSGTLMATGRRSCSQYVSLLPSATGAKEVTLDLETKKRIAPKIGDREIVGYGFNGQPNYVELFLYPCPAIRFLPNSPEMSALHEKEKGDWHTLSIDDKKAIYRQNFRCTYAEMAAPTNNGKRVLAYVFVVLTLGCFFNILVKEFFYPQFPVPSTVTMEHQADMLQRMLDQGQGLASGVAYQYDYENERWKK